jgi:hydroxymethylpyrimidine pyrophosphatase-like HAD family hydrolase
MRTLALATDYDGTLAYRDHVDDATLEALERLRKAERRAILVTGRVLEELGEVFPRLDLFDRVVAENGAVIYRPGDRTETVLAARPPAAFIEALRALGVGPIALGRVVVATWQPHEQAVAEAIRAAGLPLRVIRNKRALMVLPEGVTKATGLAVALAELGLSPEAVLGVGDAENDLDFLLTCGRSAAVANALPGVKQRVDLVTRGDHGAGVVELIDAMLSV